MPGDARPRRRPGARGAGSTGVGSGRRRAAADVGGGTDDLTDSADGHRRPPTTPRPTAEDRRRRTERRPRRPRRSRGCVAGERRAARGAPPTCVGRGAGQEEERGGCRERPDDGRQGVGRRGARTREGCGGCSQSEQEHHRGAERSPAPARGPRRRPRAARPRAPRPAEQHAACRRCRASATASLLEPARGEVDDHRADRGERRAGRVRERGDEVADRDPEGHGDHAAQRSRPLSRSTVPAGVPRGADERGPGGRRPCRLFGAAGRVESGQRRIASRPSRATCRDRHDSTESRSTASTCSIGAAARRSVGRDMCAASAAADLLRPAAR